MINTVLQLSTPTLIIGGIACTTLVPAIEAALRAIVGTGQLILNRGHCSYTKWSFSPSKSFTTTPLYKNIGLDYIAKITKDIDEEKLTDAKLPDSCKYDSNKPNSKLTLRYEGTDCTFDIDKEAFKKYSVQYKDTSEDFDASNNQIGSYADDQTNQCIIPAIFTEDSFKLLSYYLNNKALFNNKSPELKKLDLEEFIDLYKLAVYLQISDLEARCVKTIKDFIDSGIIDIDQFDNSLKDKKINEKYYIEDKSFKDLLVEIKNYKQIYNVTEYRSKINVIESNKDFIKNKIAKQLDFSVKCIRHSLVPIVGPIYTHIERFKEHNEGTGTRSIPSFSSDLIIGLSIITTLVSPLLGLGGSIYGLSLVLRSSQVAMVASIALIPIKVAFFVLGTAFKVIVFVATPILKVIGSILVIGLLAAALIR